MCYPERCTNLWWMHEVRHKVFQILCIMELKILPLAVKMLGHFVVDTPFAIL